MISHEIIYDFKGDSRNDALIIIEKEPSQFICSVQKCQISHSTCLFKNFQSRNRFANIIKILISVLFVQRKIKYRLFLLIKYHFSQIRISYYLLKLIEFRSAVRVCSKSADSLTRTSRPDRLREIADRFNLDQNAMLDNVLYCRAYTSMFKHVLQANLYLNLYF